LRNLWCYDIQESKYDLIRISCGYHPHDLAIIPWLITHILIFLDHSHSHLFLVWPQYPFLKVNILSQILSQNSISFPKIILFPTVAINPMTYHSYSPHDLSLTFSFFFECGVNILFQNYPFPNCPHIFSLDMTAKTPSLMLRRWPLPNTSDLCFS